MDELARGTKKSTKSTLDPGGFHINKDKPAAAPVAAPAAAEMPDEEATKAAQRRKAAAMQQRGGRASTILSYDERLGG